jgi:hypothetical protein
METEIERLFKTNPVVKKIWKDVLNSFKRRDINHKTIPVIGETPFILTKIGLQKGIIKTSQRTLKHIEEKHPEAWLYMENILDYIADPMAIFGSLNEEQKHSVIVITEQIMKSRDGNKDNKELMTIILTQNGKIKNIDGYYTILASIYGFNEFDIEKHLKGKKNENKEFVGTLKYIDKEKALKIADFSSLQGISSMMLRWNNFKSEFNILTKENIVKHL